jgi:hypothetical protein
MRISSLGIEMGGVRFGLLGGAGGLCFRVPHKAATFVEAYTAIVTVERKKCRLRLEPPLFGSDNISRGHLSD